MKFSLQAELLDFDEAAYLERYPDVADGVHRGDMRSGRAHFEEFGWREGRNGRAPSLTVFMLGHQRHALASADDYPHVRKIFLPDISPDNRLAESRIFTTPEITACANEYIGLASSSWNTKYGPDQLWHGRKWPHCLPVEQLRRLTLTRGVVWCAAITDNVHWSRDLDNIFPGVHQIVLELMDHFGLRQLERLAPLANNFVAHRDIAMPHARFMRRAIEFLDRRYGNVWPVRPDRLSLFADRLPAFACEAASILWFAQQIDLELKQIPSP